MIALKLPIGLSALALIGLFLFFARRLPSEYSPEWNVALSVVLAALLLFLLALAMGSTYAGIMRSPWSFFSPFSPELPCTQPSPRSRSR
jgi:hypothetical protein